MEKPLLDVVFMSEKRMDALLLLQDGAKEMEYILRSLGTTRQALLPQVRILEEHYLVDHCKDTYELTTIGRLVVDEMLPLLSTVETFDADIDYWGSRKLDFIPPHLFKRINELQKCNAVNPSFAEAYELHAEYGKASKRSKQLVGVTTFFHPTFIEVFSELISSNVNVYIIITRDLLDTLQANPNPDFHRIVDNNLFHLFVYPYKIDFLSFGYNDYYLLMRLLKINGEHDAKYTLCSSPSAIKWGKELFEYYLKDSKPITEL
jgi:predicted transcriptional regulator